MKTKLALLSALVVASAALAGCGNMMKAKSLAEPQIEKFHQQFNDEKYADIYSASDPQFQKSASEQKLTDLLSAVHRKLGAVTSSTNQGWNVSTLNTGTKIVMVQDTKFEHGSATETFAFIIADPNATLLGYNINSADLIEK